MFDPQLDGQRLRDNPQQWLKGFEERAQRLQQHAEQAEMALAQTAVTLTSRDQSVTVTVGPGSTLQALQFSPRAEGMTLLQLATTIMDTYQAACIEVAQQTTEVMSGLVGEDSQAMDFLRSLIPGTNDEGGR